ncbi:TetR/AcrR family transcriptional regulator [Limnobacter sp.]|uniref:TetR/AcrR family transcriptional regulator n=1 Tax=Limnobacter sp. TaxID=2003368 RepID=UPI0027341870|nr:TetR/AcrR family transcriptional regulator [Limnobacter sp.]MDP3270239.1 helix-turn-helix domain-containing protein [Limnobacter sp.]
MAKTKRDQDREAKHDEIVAAARALFIEEGYDASSMSRLASTAGVAPNTIYWYFKDKDEVLVAVLDAEFSASLEAYLSLSASNPVDRLLWVANKLERVSRLVSTVHSRLEKSPTIYAWHEQFHSLSEEMLRMELQQAGVAKEMIEARVKISVFTIEGLLAHRLPEEEKRAICAALLSV